jgi:hypothetical protein
MNTIEKKLEELNLMVTQGKALEAFGQFYHPEVVMQENEQSPTMGKQANRTREESFFSNISEFRGAEVLGMAVSDNVSFVIWKYDYTHREWGVRNYTQVSVQHWQDGLIIKEQFFYGS